MTLSVECSAKVTWTNFYTADRIDFQEPQIGTNKDQIKVLEKKFNAVDFSYLTRTLSVADLSVVT